MTVSVKEQPTWLKMTQCRVTVGLLIPQGGGGASSALIRGQGRLARMALVLTRGTTCSSLMLLVLQIGAPLLIDWGSKYFLFYVHCIGPSM